MKTSKLTKLCKNQIDVSIDRMHELCSMDKVDDAKSIYDELKEWINESSIDVMTLEYINEIYENY